MSVLKTIGVIGGMGPAATVQFMDRVIALTYAEDDIDHVPLRVDQNPQIPSRIKALIEGGPEDPAPTITDMAKRLEGQGCAAIVMPCNTAHHYAEQIAAAIDIPFLNMITLSAQTLRAQFGSGAKIGMLASPATDQLGVFQKVFDQFEMHAQFPDDADHVLSIIREIKAEGVTQDLCKKFLELASQHRADCLLVGCSEFSMMTDQIASDILVFDTVDILARATIEFSGGRLK